MALKRASHAIYDCNYHLVWAAKYRNWILRNEVRKLAEQLFREIADNFGFDIETMEIEKEHVHIFISFPPRYSISKVVGILKSISAKEIFRECPIVKKELWGGEFWEDGYFVRTVGDKVTQDLIKKYIENHKNRKLESIQLDLF